MRLPTLVAGAAIAAMVAVAPFAQAEILGNNVNINFSGSTTSFSLASNAGYTLYGTNGDPFNPVDISTTGTAQVNSLGAPFYSPPQPTSDFTNRGTVTYGPGMQYTSFPTETNIPYSLDDTYIGLAFTGMDGVHYGYAEFNGTDLLAYGYQTDPNTAIIAGSPFSGPIGGGTPVPEPGSLALLATGLLGLGLMRRRA